MSILNLQLKLPGFYADSAFFNLGRTYVLFPRSCPKIMSMGDFMKIPSSVEAFPQRLLH